MENTESTKCQIIERQLIPCFVLRKALERYNRKGASFVDLVNVNTHQKTRSFATLKSGEYSKNGIVMNFCPFCGADIGSHVNQKAI